MTPRRFASFFQTFALAALMASDGGCGLQIGLWNLIGRGDDTIGLPLLNARF